MKTKPPKEADINARLIVHQDDKDEAFAAHLAEYPLMLKLEFLVVGCMSCRLTAKIPRVY